MNAAGATTHEIAMLDCLNRLRAEPVGRICIFDHGFPIAIPMNYRVLGDHPDVQIVLRTAPDTTIGRYHGSASLEVDHIDLEAGQAWSIIVRGTLRPLHGTDAAVDPAPFVGTGRSRWMILGVTAISGRTFEAHRTPDGAEQDWHAVAPQQYHRP